MFESESVRGGSLLRLKAGHDNCEPLLRKLSAKQPIREPHRGHKLKLNGVITCRLQSNDILTTSTMQ